jgi:hypothetical protein
MRSVLSRRTKSLKPAGNHDPLPAHNDFVEPMIVFAFYQAILEYYDIGLDGSLTAFTREPLVCPLHVVLTHYKGVLKIFLS